MNKINTRSIVHVIATQAHRKGSPGIWEWIKPGSLRRHPQQGLQVEGSSSKCSDETWFYTGVLNTHW
jgi:hypothetical protein